MKNMNCIHKKMNPYSTHVYYLILCVFVLNMHTHLHTSEQIHRSIVPKMHCFMPDERTVYSASLSSEGTLHITQGTINKWDMHTNEQPVVAQASYTVSSAALKGPIEHISELFFFENRLSIAVATAHNVYVIQFASENDQINKHTTQRITTHTTTIKNIGVVKDENTIYVFSSSVYPTLKGYNVSKKKAVPEQIGFYLLGTYHNGLVIGGIQDIPGLLKRLWDRWGKKERKVSFFINNISISDVPYLNLNEQFIYNAKNTINDFLLDPNKSNTAIAITQDGDLRVIEEHKHSFTYLSLHSHFFKFSLPEKFPKNLSHSYFLSYVDESYRQKWIGVIKQNTNTLYYFIYHPHTISTISHTLQHNVVNGCISSKGILFYQDAEGKLYALTISNLIRERIKNDLKQFYTVQLASDRKSITLSTPFTQSFKTISWATEQKRPYHVIPSKGRPYPHWKLMQVNETVYAIWNNLKELYFAQIIQLNKNNIWIPEAIETKQMNIILEKNTTLDDITQVHYDSSNKKLIVPFTVWEHNQPKEEGSKNIEFPPHE